MREIRKVIASIFLAMFATLAVKYFMNPEIKIENKFKKTFKENTNFYVLNKILTNKEKEKLIYSLNSESFTNKVSKIPEIMICLVLLVFLRIVFHFL